MNIDITYHHTGTFRLAVYTRHAQLTELSTDRAVDIALADLPTVRGLTADGMRALIEAKQLPAFEALKPDATGHAVGDIWQNRCGARCAVVHGAKPPHEAWRWTIVELAGRAPLVYEVGQDGRYLRAGNGEQHPKDLIKRTGSFL